MPQQVNSEDEEDQYEYEMDEDEDRDDDEDDEEEDDKEGQGGDVIDNEEMKGLAHDAAAELEDED